MADTETGGRLAQPVEQVIDAWLHLRREARQGVLRAILPRALPRLDALARAALVGELERAQALEGTPEPEPYLTTREVLEDLLALPADEQRWVLEQCAPRVAAELADAQRAVLLQSLELELRLLEAGEAPPGP